MTATASAPLTSVEGAYLTDGTHLVRVERVDSEGALACIDALTDEIWRIPVDDLEGWRSVAPSDG